jgi:Tol biopolymer transport system component
VSLRDGDFEVYTVLLSGEGHLRLTERAGPDTGPAWSADGTRIAFISNRDGPRDVYTMASDGSDVRRVTTDAGALQPAW